MLRRLSWAVLATAMALGGCSGEKIAKATHSAQQVDRIIVMKERRRMYLLDGENIVRSYQVDLGFQPSGDKVQRGDGRTPEGRYTISSKNVRSKYYLSLGVSYPNIRDRSEAAALGVDPGGGIFIHGEPSFTETPDKADWTAGCIAVSDVEMYEIYTLVSAGTIIDIFP